MTWSNLQTEIAAEFAGYRVEVELEALDVLLLKEQAQRKSKTEREKERRKDPAVRAAAVQYQLRRRREEPEYNQKHLDATNRRNKARYWSDEEYREKCRAKARERKARKRGVQGP